MTPLNPDDNIRRFHVHPVELSSRQKGVFKSERSLPDFIGESSLIRLKDWWLRSNSPTVIEADLHCINVLAHTSWFVVECWPLVRDEPEAKKLIRWRNLYGEAELYKAAVRTYTKPLFLWRKALNVSTDGKTLYDLAVHGLKGLNRIHQQLRKERFHFRPSVGLRYNFNGKRRTLYIPPWEERIVDLLLYRMLNKRLHPWFSPSSYAYRDHSYGLDTCQSRIAAVLRANRTPFYLVKRDISDYFASVDHEILLEQLAAHVDRNDYLFAILDERIRFEYQDDSGHHHAVTGIPFGCASACVLANVYLTGLDRALESVPGIKYFRYADDLLLLSPSRDAAVMAAERMQTELHELRLTTKASHEHDLLLACETMEDLRFRRATSFRHLGLEFDIAGRVSLSRDKLRKIQNLFRFAFRRNRRRWGKIGDPRERARTLIAIAGQTVERGVRNVAIVDYYLKHTTDVPQLRLLDRWLAEEILSLVFGGHKRAHFAKISFAQLRQWGLPSMVHRHRLIRHRKIDSSFFIWQQQKIDGAFKGTVASRRCTSGAACDFSRNPEAAARKSR